MSTSRVNGFFVFFADYSKKLVSVWSQHLSAIERSSWVNTITRQLPPFFYLLPELCPLVNFIFAFFKTFKIHFHGVPALNFVLLQKIHFFTSLRWHFQTCSGSITKKFLSGWQILAIKDVGGLSESIKEGKFVTKSFFR